jgi:hypothetical protein
MQRLYDADIARPQPSCQKLDIRQEHYGPALAGKLNPHVIM